MKLKNLSPFAKKNQTPSKAYCDLLSEDMSAELLEAPLKQTTLLRKPSNEISRVAHGISTTASAQVIGSTNNEPLFECDFDAFVDNSAAETETEQKTSKDTRRKKTVVRATKTPSRRKLVTAEVDVPVPVVSPVQKKETKKVSRRGLHRAASELQQGSIAEDVAQRQPASPRRDMRRMKSDLRLSPIPDASTRPARGLRKASSELRLSPAAQGSSAINAASSGQGRLANRRKMNRTRSELNVPGSPKKEGRKMKKASSKRTLKTKN